MRKKLIPALNKSLLLPLADRLMNTNIIRYYREIEQMISWNREEIEKWRSLKLQNLIQHAYNNTIYYTIHIYYNILLHAVYIYIQILFKLI